MNKMARDLNLNHAKSICNTSIECQFFPVYNTAEIREKGNIKMKKVLVVLPRSIIKISNRMLKEGGNPITKKRLKFDRF